MYTSKAFEDPSMNHIGNILSEYNTQTSLPFSQTNTQTHTYMTQSQPHIQSDDSLFSYSQPVHSSYAEPIAMPLEKTTLDEKTVKHVQAIVKQMKEQLDALTQLLEGTATATIPTWTQPQTVPLPKEETANVIEGVFNGQHMIGPDGTEYPIPPNYASKSKLVEGDWMKLTVGHDGTLRYKQIGPIERKNIRGELLFDATKHQWSVIAEGRIYKVLTASVTFHKGNIGDEVVILVPKDGESEWAAIEHVFKR